MTYAYLSPPFRNGWRQPGCREGADRRIFVGESLSKYREALVRWDALDDTLDDHLPDRRIGIAEGVPQRPQGLWPTPLSQGLNGITLYRYVRIGECVAKG